ncbi:ATP-binding protein [Sphingomonas aracearum]|uniref:histidine kinase n=1 Tax=Sphingomonas aracearum TaxID=2283317 RepID=A0A369W4M2_9SPHN|nr:ATP-binding protein [Sphingomonas aracearum]RDE07001.1 ATPase [Sphingomonas aracearum]
MLPAATQRTFSALVLVAVAAGAVAMVTQDWAASLITLVGGVAAVLLGIGAPVSREELPGMLAGAPAAPIGMDELIEAVGQPMLIVANGRVQHANQSACALLGQHIVGEDVRLAIRHPGAAERLATGEPFDGTVDLVGLGALDQRWQMKISTAAGGQKIVHLVDQTGSYAAERMRVDFVANASHELRTPLASILGYIETLEDEAGDEPALRRRFLKVMFDEARRMQRLVEDLISLSRIEAEKYRLPDTPVDLLDLTNDVHAELARAADGRGGDIVTALADDVPPVTGDRAQLSQLLHNVIGNALKYGRPGTPVTVRLGRDGRMVRLSVSDESDGIAPAHLPRLTERFYRVDAGRSRAAGGTGLGLAIVKHIVERHRGRLDITSVVGTGTTITVLLPPHGSAVTKA